MYTIKVKDGTRFKPLIAALEKRVAKSRFTAVFSPTTKNEIHVKPVRLRTSKPYCGQHPGECLVGGPRRRLAFLEWEDWVQFNDLVNDVVNDVLDSLGVVADVWTVPPEKMDQGRKFWIRRDRDRRHRWSYTTDYSQGRGFRIWNHGTPDQFTKEAS
jgi:hypothetical protein